MTIKPTFRLLTRFLLCYSLLALCCPKTQASNGTYDEKTGVYNFTVSVEFVPTPEQLALIEQRFTEADEIFYDATDGQQHFGKIIIYTNAAKRQISTILSTRISLFKI